MKIKYTGSEALSLALAEHREGNADLSEGDTALGKSLLSSSAQFEEVSASKSNEATPKSNEVKSNV